MVTDERSALEETRNSTAPATHSEAPEKPELEIVGGPGRLNLNSLSELWHFREVLAAFTMRDVKVRYKQAVVGVGWAVLQPVFAAGIFALFIGRLTDVPSEGLPYLVFALSGMVAWTYFSSAALNGSQSLTLNEGMLRKIFFPREILPLSAVIAALVDLLPALCVLATVVFLYGLSADVTWLAIPIPIALLIVFAAAVSAAFSAINVYYRDVKYALPFAFQLGLFASPVIYPLAIVPDAWRDIYAVLNPVATAIDGLRRTMLHGEWPEWGLTSVAFGWSVLLLVLGFALFKRLERGFADRI